MQMPEDKQLNSYELSRDWFDFCFESPELISPIHTALYFFCIEHCNRLGWKEKFGLPTQMAMDAIGVKNWRTYSKAFDDLVKWKFIKVVQRSKNQYSATVIAIVKNTTANTKALTKAMQKHLQKHSQKQSSSIAVINKQLKLNNNLNQETKKIGGYECDFIDDIFLPIIRDWIEYKNSRGEKYSSAKSILALYKKLIKLSGGDPEVAKQIIDESMAQNWAGIFELKDGKSDKNHSRANAARNEKQQRDEEFRASIAADLARAQAEMGEQ